ncbi:MAG: hypothetical protein ONA90_02700 [candidate division KSB1 bacterium]|nr:hypothetical protein [candidate division KSB1 bacterium]
MKSAINWQVRNVRRSVGMTVLTFVLCLPFCRCTSNPFGGDDKISAGTSKIYGTLQLNDSASPAGVYVWLEGFGVNTRTNANGHFEVTLPPPSSQGSGGGVSGVFRLYFYSANYKLASAQVLTRNGAFVYASGDVNANGEVSSPTVLAKFLRIKTAVTPASVPVHLAANITVQVTLEAVDDSVTVVFPHAIGGMLGAILLKPTASEQVFVVHALPGVVGNEVTIVGRARPHTRGMVFNLQQTSLPPAQYQVVPYLLIRHEAIPAGLMASLGANAEAPGPNYLNIPFHREGGQFTVESSNPSN